MRPTLIPLKTRILPQKNLLFLLLLFLVALSFLANLVWGSVNIPLDFFFGGDEGDEWQREIHANIVTRTRLPQALVATGAGMSLALAGLMLQTLFRNPLAGPSVLGISSGASLGVAFVILLAGPQLSTLFRHFALWGELLVIAAAFTGALLILLLILGTSLRLPGTLGILIIGIMVGYLSSSLVSMLKFFSSETDLHSYIIWGLGSFARLSPQRAVIFILLAGLPSLGLLTLGKTLNLMALGENYAANLGLNTAKARIIILLVAGYLTAVVTAFCGPIAFIGMAVPHLCKFLLRTGDHRTLLPATLLLGAATALLCNLAARLPGMDATLPINSVTAFVGAPVIISLILSRRFQH
ncbi:iron ABC transporter permease [Geofilum rhodophaeum]|uniref:iron ABC transporter permease n=1 Tax=Geofilum rhodophaeum TaxID=1965019 RepID=UPI000B522CC5|nr:iron ABC transporter permease [Geofilum rhodophaeum]